MERESGVCVCVTSWRDKGKEMKGKDSHSGELQMTAKGKLVIPLCLYVCVCNVHTCACVRACVKLHLESSIVMSHDTQAIRNGEPRRVIQYEGLLFKMEPGDSVPKLDTNP